MKNIEPTEVISFIVDEKNKNKKKGNFITTFS